MPEFSFENPHDTIPKWLVHPLLFFLWLVFEMTLVTGFHP